MCWEGPLSGRAKLGAKVGIKVVHQARPGQTISPSKHVQPIPLEFRWEMGKGGREKARR